MKIFAGVHRSRNGAVTPIGTGRHCNWTPDPDGIPADQYPSFGAYQRSLTLVCEAGEPGIITWKPDENTPDTVFYQCFTHRYLGWRINVLDSCDIGSDSEFDASEVEESYVPEASIRHETKILPNELFLLQHEKDLIKNHNMNEVPPKIQFDLNKNSEISKIIADGIKAAEELEESIANPKSNKTYDDERIEFKIVSTNLHSQHVKPSTVPPKDHRIQQDEVSPLSEYLRPPGLQNGPVFRPVKVAGRRPTPMQVERRRPPTNQYRLNLPQPSIIVNHYKKPVSPLMRPFVKEQKPIKSIASFLLLGQQTELAPVRKTYEQKPQNGTKSKKGPFRPPYRETIPTKIFHHAEPIVAQSSQNIGIRKKPQVRQPYLPLKGTKGSFKAPYEVINHSNEASVHFNNGFQPDSVIVESGFKPIVRRRTDDDEAQGDNSNRRSDDNLSDIDDNIEGDALFINQDNIPNRSFEPMFIPSPPDSINSSNKKILAKEHLTGDLAEMEVEEGDDKMAMAGERVDAYYLPPDTHKLSPHQSAYPEGSVVTYDGKAVLDTSLVNSLPPIPAGLSLPNNIVYRHQNSGHLSKTEQLIRSTPQFGPFKGEIPPIGQDFSPPDFVPHKKSNQTGTSANSSSSKPYQAPVTEYTNPLTNNTNPISTKLILLSPIAARSNRGEENERESTSDEEVIVGTRL